MLKLNIAAELEFARSTAPEMDDHELLGAFAVWSVRTAGPNVDREALQHFEVLCVYRAELLQRLQR
jgi:hypothetical protein